MKILISLSLCLCCLSGTYGQETFLGFERPVLSVEIFAEGLISTNLKQRDLTVSPDRSEMYFTVFGSGFDGNIYFSKFENEQWSIPKIAPFSGGSQDLEPSFSPDGSRLYFSSNRGSSSFDIYYVNRQTDGTWSDPIDVGSPINTSADEFYPSVAENGSLYFTANYSRGQGGEDIWYAEWEDGAYKEPVALTGFCGSTDEFNAYVAPDESFIYFSSFGRPDGQGGGDLYIARKDASGEWSPASNLGARVNSILLDYSPFVLDGFLFFTSTRPLNINDVSANVFDPAAVMGNLLSPNRSTSNIYWVNR